MSEFTATNQADNVVGDSSRYYVTEHHPENGTLLGFWMYLMSDCLIFACLFATYAVLGRNYAGGPSGAELFELPTVALNTAFLLLSSITYGFAMLAAHKNVKSTTIIWLGITGIFGLCFLFLEIQEFVHLIHEGAGLHVTFGVVWLVTLMFQVGKHGLTMENIRRLTCLSMFWHFLDVVWIGVFTFVYLMGTLP
jgi:cytochrome o ubiquinol oxidase subunit 3